MAPDRLSADLAFVNARIPFLGPFDLQDPLVRLRMIIWLEALVARVRVQTYGQYVDVPVSYPGDLEPKRHLVCVVRQREASVAA